MGRIGLPEILVVLFIVGLLLAPFVLRRKLGGRIWLGVILAFILGPWGHWYLEGGAVYVVAVWALAVVLGVFLPSAWLSWLGLCIVSTLLMSYRFKKKRASELGIEKLTP